MLRSILAVVAGFVVTAVLAISADAVLVRLVPDAFGPGGRTESIPILLVIQAYVAAAAIFGCWLAARLAPHSPMRHALVLGALGLAFNVAGSLAQWDITPAWYHALAWALVMPYAWLGGRLREIQIERAAAPSMAPAA
jgi:hypothetical protein